MRKLNVFLIAALAVVTIMSSCKKDDDPVGPPTLNFIGGEGFVDTDATIAVNTIFKVGIAATSNAETSEKLSSLRLTRTVDGTAFIDTTFTINENTFNINFEFNAQQDGVVETIAFVLTDKAGQMAEKSLTITYDMIYTGVTKHSDVTMGSYNDDYGSFYASGTNTVYSKADATSNQSMIDFIFYLGATNGSTIASPADNEAAGVFEIQGWTTKNATLFAETDITAEDFAAIGTEYDFPEFSGDLTDVNQIEMGNVFMFKTVENKLGLIKVNQINSRGDFVSLDIIVSN
jgi:hypothetical protein